MFCSLSEPDVDTEDAGQFPMLDGASHSVASGAVTVASQRKIGPMKWNIAQRLRKKERQSSQPFAVEGVEDSHVEAPVNKWWNGEDKHQSHITESRLKTNTSSGSTVVSDGSTLIALRSIVQQKSMR